MTKYLSKICINHVCLNFKCGYLNSNIFLMAIVKRLANLECPIMHTVYMKILKVDHHSSVY